MVDAQTENQVFAGLARSSTNLDAADGRFIPTVNRQTGQEPWSQKESVRSNQMPYALTGLLQTG